MNRLWQRALIAVVALLLLVGFALTRVSAQTDGWQASYWNNISLTGAPVLTRVDPEINFNWGSGSPHASVNADNFSARWTRTLSLQAGVYEFTMRTDNGGRLWVNNQIVINQWWDHPPRTDTARVTITGGNVPVRMEMYERTLAAEAQLSWRRVSDTVPPTATPTRVPGPTATPQPTGMWQASYYDNIYMTGLPVLQRREAQIEYDWGFGSPGAGVPSDRFSARWTTIVDLPAGNYRFSAYSDDGILVWVNNQLIINQWYDHSVLLASAVYSHGGGGLPIRVEYYERTGSAVARFNWQRVDAAPTPVPAATATPQPNAGTCTIVNVYVLNVRYTPSLSAAVVARVVRGEVTTFTGARSGAWMQIRTAAGVTGWINGYYCMQGPIR